MIVFVIFHTWVIRLGVNVTDPSESHSSLYDRDEAFQSAQQFIEPEEQSCRTVKEQTSISGI